jgi:hypothetical protein
VKLIIVARISYYGCCFHSEEGKTALHFCGILWPWEFILPGKLGVVGQNRFKVVLRVLVWLGKML